MTSVQIITGMMELNEITEEVDTYAGWERRGFQVRKGEHETQSRGQEEDIKMAKTKKFTSIDMHYRAEMLAGMVFEKARGAAKKSYDAASALTEAEMDGSDAIDAVAMEAVLERAFAEADMLIGLIDDSPMRDDFLRACADEDPDCYKKYIGLYMDV